MSEFASGLTLLDDFDNKQLDRAGNTVKEAVFIDVPEFLNVIDKMKPEFGSDIFANPKDDSFNSSVRQIYQTFGGKDCYPSLEEKAAMLLYLIVKIIAFPMVTNVLAQIAFSILCKRTVCFIKTENQLLTMQLLPL